MDHILDIYHLMLDIAELLLFFLPFHLIHMRTKAISQSTYLGTHTQI